MQHFSIWSLLRNSMSYHEGWQKQWRSPEPKSHYDVVVVGAGGHGLATAYYLAKEHGIKNIAVVERGWLGGGNTARNTTIVRSNYLWDEATALYEKSLKLWEGLSQDLNYNVMFSQRGVMNLGHTLQDMRDIERRVNANRLNGVDAKVISAALAKRSGSTAELNAMSEKLGISKNPKRWTALNGVLKGVLKRVLKGGIGLASFTLLYGISSIRRARCYRF